MTLLNKSKADRNKHGKTIFVFDDFAAAKALSLTVISRERAERLWGIGGETDNPGVAYKTLALNENADADIAKVCALFRKNVGSHGIYAIDSDPVLDAASNDYWRKRSEVRTLTGEGA